MSSNQPRKRAIDVRVIDGLLYSKQNRQTRYPYKITFNILRIKTDNFSYLRHESAFSSAQLFDENQHPRTTEPSKGHASFIFKLSEQDDFIMFASHQINSCLDNLLSYQHN